MSSTGDGRPAPGDLVIAHWDRRSTVSAPAVRQYGRRPDAPDVVSTGQVLERMHGAVAVAGHLAAEHGGAATPEPPAGRTARRRPARPVSGRVAAGALGHLAALAFDAWDSPGCHGSGGC